VCIQHYLGIQLSAYSTVIAANEKGPSFSDSIYTSKHSFSLVYQFLQGMAMAGEEPDNAPPRSVTDASEFRNRAESARSQSPPIYSPAPKSKASATLIGPNGFGTSQPQRNGSKVNAGRDDVAGDDVDSNVQEGVRSEVGEIIPLVRLNLLPFSLYVVFNTHSSANLVLKICLVQNTHPMILGLPSEILDRYLQMIIRMLRITHMLILPGMYVSLFKSYIRDL
jgi:hypothetical protein